MVIVASLLGALTGIVTGLVPSIHVNTVTALLLAASASCASLGIEYSALLAFTCSLAISHTFFDVVPGLFLGIPGDETFALLPGHELVKQGKGNLAIRLSVAGSTAGLIIGVVIVVALLAFGNVIGAVENAVGPWMLWILLAVSVLLIVTDSPRGWSLVVFLTSGLLGVVVLGTPLVAGGSDAPINALFPALAGLFGVAGLVFAIATAGPSGERPSPPPDESPNPTIAAVAGPGVRGGFAGLVVGLLPGLGAANAATLLLLLEQWFGRRVSRDDQSRAYLVTTSSLNTAEALFAIAALYLIGRSRSGASIAVEQILGGIVAQTDLLLISLFMILAGVIAAAILWRMGGSVASWVSAADEIGLNWSVVAFLVVLTLLLLGLGGLVILVCATVVGLVPLVFKVRRAQLMGFFLVPTMLFYSGQQGRVVDWLSLEQRTAPLLPSVTLSGITLAVLVSIAVALAAYRLTRWVVLPTAQSDNLPAHEVSKVGKVVGFATGAGAALILAVALLGGAYPRDEIVAGGNSAPMKWADGRIARMIDGDTADIASACRRFRVRFSGIDAPELGSAAGDRARDWAQSTFENQAVTWSAVGVDVYGRFLGLLQLPDGTSINQEIIRQGYARPNVATSQLGQTQSPGTSSPSPPADRPAASELTPVAEPLPWDDNGNGRISCAEARAHGIAPVRRDHPAYRYMRDGDGDGVVCE